MFNNKVPVKSTRINTEKMTAMKLCQVKRETKKKTQRELIFSIHTISLIVQLESYINFSHILGWPV